METMTTVSIQHYFSYIRTDPHYWLTRAQYLTMYAYLGQVKLGVGQVIPDTYLPERHMTFSDKHILSN